MLTASHAQVHTHFAALAVEVGHQLLKDELLVLFADVGVVLNGLCVNAVLVLSGQLTLFQNLELGTGNLTNGANETFGHYFCFMDITANGANKFLHNLILQINIMIVFSWPPLTRGLSAEQADWGREISPSGKNQEFLPPPSSEGGKAAAPL